MKQGYRDWEPVSENHSTPLVKWLLLSLPRSPEPWKKRTSGYFALGCVAPRGVNSLYGIGIFALQVYLSESGPQQISRTIPRPFELNDRAVYRGDCARLLRGSLQIRDSEDQHEDRSEQIKLASTERSKHRHVVPLTFLSKPKLFSSRKGLVQPILLRCPTLLSVTGKIN